MPTYEFRCRTCDTTFDLRRSMADSDAPATCPDGHEAVRQLSSFAAITGGSSPSRSNLPMAPPSGGGGCGGACACHG